MGLDMYLTGKKYFPENWENPEKNQTEDGFRLKEHQLDLGYWRKHPDLHTFIVQTFNDGEDVCHSIEFSEGDLEKIIKAIETDALAHESKGFFFGNSAQPGKEGYAEQKEEDLKVFKRALQWVCDAPKPAEVEKGTPREWRRVEYRASW